MSDIVERLLIPIPWCEDYNVERREAADEIERLVSPKGLIVVVQAQHYCMKWRGVREPDTMMTNSVVRGVFREQPQMKAEFLNLIGMPGFG